VSKDQAARTIGKRIAETYRATLVCTQAESDARHANVAKQIDSAIKRAKSAAVRKERERCVLCIINTASADYLARPYIKAINGGKR